MAENEPIFNFMYVRPALALDEHAARRDYVRDLFERVAEPTEWVDGRAFQPNGSTITQTVADLVFTDFSAAEGLAALKQELLAMLVSVNPTFELERYPYLVDDGTFYLLPGRLDMLTGLPLYEQVLTIVDLLSKEPAPGVARLAKRLGEVSDGQPLRDLVFAEDGHTKAYMASNRELFDVLYLLYMLRRWASIDLDPVMRGIRALHVLEALALDELVAAAIDGSIDQVGLAKLQGATRYFPELADWDRKHATDELPPIPHKAALAAYWNATPVIHPIFARLFYYVHPFNDIKPLGVGDLKVVKQTLLRYEAGEISDIHNVMKGEQNRRDHRRLEKTEELFSFSGSSEQETQRDSQSTDRSEIKREAENVIKTDISGSAGASVTYNQNPVSATVSAGFAASRSGQETEKSANNFSKEIVAKALDRVVKRTSEQRNTTKIFETEERNRHQLSNVKGDAHVNGIYQWVDKRYRAQVYNFGKRMMFEFMVPEPASFLVEQRLRGFEAALQMPIKPTREADGEVVLDFEPNEIDEALFAQLKAEYGLEDFQYPPRVIKAQVLDGTTGEQLIAATQKLADNQLSAFPAKLSVTEVEGYDLDWIGISGSIEYGESLTGDAMSNALMVRVNGALIWSDDVGTIKYASYPPEYSTDLDGYTVSLTQNNPAISVELADAATFQLVMSVRLTLNAAGLLSWQKRVSGAVARIEQTKVNAANKEKQLAFESAMTTYNNRLDEIRAVAVNDLLQGKSEAYNRATIIRELKRACISLIAKEFDADESDDLLTEWEMMGEFDVSSKVTRMNVDRSQDPATARFETTWDDLIFPAMDIGSTRGKGRYIQFLEQAFEWHQLGWVSYPYFWTPPPKWVQLMSREDQTDQALTDFLQAGAAKVLLAVSPEYDDAVLHFLATREPWEGGEAPALGDPLYLPLYEEMHKAQDDTYGGTPVGEPWEYTVPTSLVYLKGSEDELPDFTETIP
jgi:hypothetical protein